MSRCALCFIVVLSAPLAVAAQESEQDEAAAIDQQSLAQEGVDLFARHEYESALRAFRALYEIAPSGQLRFNIAFALERLGRRLEAANEYEEALGEDLGAEGRLRAEEALLRVRAQLGRVRITGPQGARARVDAQPPCDVPCELWLEPGGHRVSLLGAEQVRRITIVPATIEEVVLTAPAAAERVVPSARPPEPSDGWSYPSGMTWAGILTTALFGGAIVGFGVRALDIEAAYPSAPTPELFDEGQIMETITNLSIGGAALGGVLIVVDLLIEAADPQ